MLYYFVHFRFTGDVDLQNLDKEDALICFENHICMLEQEHDENKERERRKNKREQRKNRESFIVLLDELHEFKLLTSVSLWKDLYNIIKGYVMFKIYNYWMKFCIFNLFLHNYIKRM